LNPKPAVDPELIGPAPAESATSESASFEALFSFLLLRFAAKSSAAKNTCTESITVYHQTTITHHAGAGARI
jgi:hypothetical protein